MRPLRIIKAIANTNKKVLEMEPIGTHRQATAKHLDLTLPVKETITVLEARKLASCIKAGISEAGWKQSSTLNPELELTKRQAFDILLGFIINDPELNPAQLIWYCNFESIIKEFVVNKQELTDDSWKQTPLITALADEHYGHEAL